MNIRLIIVVSLTIISFALIKKKYEQHKGVKHQDTALDEYEEMQELFYARIQEGVKAYRVASFYNLSDIALVKSLLQSAAIPYFFEFEHMAQNRTGLPIHFYNNAILNIIEEDYDEVLEILEAYNDKKINSPVSTGDRVRSAAEGIIAGWAAQSPKHSLIEIYYK